MHLRESWRPPRTRHSYRRVARLGYPEVVVSLTSHDVGGITSRDIDLAREISAIAAELGITHDMSIIDVDPAEHAPGAGPLPG